MSRRRIRLALAGCFAFALALVAFAVLGGDEETRSTRVVPGDDFVGIVSEDVFAGDAAYRRSTLRRQARAGIGLVRQTFDSSQIEKSPGRYDLSYYDDYVAQLAAGRVRLLPILFRRGSTSAGAYPPDDPSRFGAFGAALARRYGPDGTLWRERPDVPKLPVRAWQVWNEPSLPAYWASGPDPAEYTELLRETGRAIKSVDPGAEIVTAGLPESRIGIPFEQFVTGMYDAGAKGAFDTLAIHPFARDQRGALAAVKAARALMNGRGDRGSLAAFASQRRRLGIRGVVYFNWKDARPYPGGEDFWGLHTGLLAIDGHPKPGFRAFERTAHRLLR